MLSSWYDKLEPPQKQVAGYELFLFIGWLMVFWAIGAASLSGFILTLFFCVLAIVKVVRIPIAKILAGMPKRSPTRHYTAIILAVVFFLLLASRACYIAMVVVDAGVHGGI